MNMNRNINNKISGSVNQLRKKNSQRKETQLKFYRGISHSVLLFRMLDFTKEGYQTVGSFRNEILWISCQELKITGGRVAINREG